MSDLVERLRRPVFDSEEWYSALEAAFKMRDAGHRDSCARDLMDSYVDEAATERTEAADEIERLRAEVGHWREANRTSLTAGDVLKDEVARLTAENDWLRAYTAQSAKACVYCGLGADEQGECNRGFPGCARADDQMLCREVEVAMERDELRAEVTRLTAERERGTAALRVAFGEELWQLGHPAYVVVHLRDEIEKVTRLWKASTVENAALLARVEAAERDAGRYRWLRNESLHWLIRAPICIEADTWGEPVMVCGKHSTLDGATLDAAIDAAMEGGK